MTVIAPRPISNVPTVAFTAAQKAAALARVRGILINIAADIEKAATPEMKDYWTSKQHKHQQELARLEALETT